VLDLAFGFERVEVEKKGFGWDGGSWEVEALVKTFYYKLLKLKGYCLVQLNLRIPILVIVISFSS